MNQKTYRPHTPWVQRPSQHGSVDLRRLMRMVAQPVVVVTGGRPGAAPIGMTVSSFTSVSLDPPLILFCAGVSSRRWALIRESGLFAVNILSADHIPAAGRLAGPLTELPPEVPWELGATGVAVLSGVPAVAECSIAAIHPSGDHDVVVGRVESTDIGWGAWPLAYTNGTYLSVHQP